MMPRPKKEATARMIEAKANAPVADPKTQVLLTAQATNIAAAISCKALQSADHARSDAGFEPAHIPPCPIGRNSAPTHKPSSCFTSSRLNSRPSLMSASASATATRSSSVSGSLSSGALSRDAQDGITAD